MIESILVILQGANGFGQLMENLSSRQIDNIFKVWHLSALTFSAPVRQAGRVAQTYIETYIDSELDRDNLPPTSFIL